jgi:hypothetical protein
MMFAQGCYMGHPCLLLLHPPVDTAGWGQVGYHSDSAMQHKYVKELRDLFTEPWLPDATCSSMPCSIRELLPTES